MEYEILLEIGVSKEVIRVTKDNFETVIKSKLQATVSEDFYIRPYDFGPAKNTYILQRWSSQWDSFIDFNKGGDIDDGDKFKLSEYEGNEVSIVFLDESGRRKLGFEILRIYNFN